MAAKKKLLITGAHGFVAGSILAQAGDDWQLHAVSRGQPFAGREKIRWHVCERADALSKLLEEVKPDVVIHTAALADIDFCEAHQELAREVNVELTRTYAGLCENQGARFVFCSTDAVFEGEHAPYGEADLPAPVNFYAETKVEAEGIAASLGSRSVIARLSLVVGLPVLGAGNSFLPRMIASFRAGRPVTVPAQEVRTPVDVITLGRALLELAGGSQHGIFHLAGTQRLNRFEMAQQIALHFGFSKELVIAQTEAPPGRAARPRDVSLDNAKASAHLKTPMLDLAEGLSLIQQFAARPHHEHTQD